MSRGRWLILCSFLLALTASYLLWFNEIAASQTAVGPICSSTKQTDFGPHVSPAFKELLSRKLPDDFQCDGGLQKTIHRIDDVLKVQVFLDYDSMGYAGMRWDAPVSVQVAGKTLGDALLQIMNEYDPPLTCSGDAGLVTVRAPSFRMTFVSTTKYSVDDIVSTPADAQRLIADLQSAVGSNPRLHAFPVDTGSLRISFGTLLVEEPPLFQYELAKYLNKLHRRHAILIFSIQTATMCAALTGGIAIILLIRLRKKRRRMLAGFCVCCDYDLRASVDRCPECGTSFTPASPAPATTPPLRA